MALPDYTFIDGFDKYGTNIMDNTDAGLDGIVIRGEWSDLSGDAMGITTALTGSGYALEIGNLGAGGRYGITKYLTASYARVLGGVTVRNLAMTNTGSQKTGIGFMSGASYQLSISFDLTGRLQLYRGSSDGGTLLATGTSIFTPSSIIVIEWDITFHGTTGIAKIYVNGVIEPNLSLTGINTSPVAGNSFNGFQIVHGNTQVGVLDHLYLWCYTAAGGSETPALTNPIIETHFVKADSQKQWDVGASQLGQRLGLTSLNVYSPGANRLFLIKYRCQAAGTAQSINVVPNTASATAKLRGVIYADSGGVPGSLMSSGTEVVGTTSNAQLTLPLVTPQALTAGVDYWVGYITDTSLNMNRYDSSAAGFQAANTYTSGAPATAPTMTSGAGTISIWAALTGVTDNWVQVAQGPYPTATSYNMSTTPGDEDLYEFDALSTTPAQIYSVGIKAVAYLNGTGVRTLDLRTKSNVTTSSGSLAAQSVPSSVTQYGSYFDVDPNTSAAWTAAGLNAARHGMRLVS